MPLLKPLKPPHQPKPLPPHQPPHQPLQQPKLQLHQPLQLPKLQPHQLPHNKNKQQMPTMKPKTKKTTRRKLTMMLKT